MNSALRLALIALLCTGLEAVPAMAQTMPPEPSGNSPGAASGAAAATRARNQSVFAR